MAGHTPVREELDVIEIFALYRMCRYLGRMLRSKGRNPLGWQFLLVMLWFLFEFIGGFVAEVLCVVFEGPREGVYPVAYLGAIGAAICGAAVVFLMARSLSDRRQMAPAFPVEVTGMPEAQAVAERVEG